ncbi:hypothetical protein P3S68_027719 [Capsicum galapagoense]
MAVHSFENLSPNCPLGQSSKIKRREGDAENDVSLDMHIKRMEIEKLLEEGVSSPSCTREGQTVFDKEKAVAYQRTKANKSKNPFFIYFLPPSNISRSHLTIKLTFARKYIPKNCSKIMLRVAGKESWAAIYSVGPARARISTGWSTFVVGNHLKLGDGCVFKVIKGTQVVMDVTIFHAAESMPMPMGQTIISSCYGLL